MKTPAPNVVTPKEFFDLPAVKQAVEVQKHNAYGSEPHRKAFEEIMRLATAYGVQGFFGEY